MSEEIKETIRLLKAPEILAKQIAQDLHGRPFATESYATVNVRRPNSKEHLQSITESMKAHNSHHRLKNLSLEWQTIEERRRAVNLSPPRLLLNRESLNLQESPLEIFIAHLNLGFLPPPAVLIAIKHSFEKYYLAKADLELEEIFFGPRKPRVGNASGRDAAKKEKQYTAFALDFHRQRRRAEKNGTRPLSLQKHAENYLNKINDETEITTFLRGYRRWRPAFIKRLSIPDK